MLIRCLAAVVMVLMLVALPAQATVMIYWDTKELIRRSGSVIRGEVVSQQAVLIEGRLWTDSYVRVLDTIKGKAQPGEILTVRQLGGETVEIGSYVAGAARFYIDERVLLFLRPVEHYHVVVGMGLGKYQIYRDALGRQRVFRDLTGIAFARYDYRGAFLLDHADEVDKPTDLSLKELVRNIRTQLTDGGAR
jgi:hypothetical protein